MGKGLAAKLQFNRSAIDLSALSNHFKTIEISSSSVLRCSQTQVSRVRGALTARGARRKYVLVGSVAASMPPHGPAIGEHTAPENLHVVY
ncbi:hypothetical protein EJL05_03155 [Xanthomonas arboricola pv. pruni]|nr:hypothetical protein EJL05_03155 [Xanthomonas arboricola pv. pruni]